jgi:hypothetical protein
MRKATVVASDHGHKSVLPPTTTRDVGFSADFRNSERGCLIAHQREERLIDEKKIPSVLVVHHVWAPRSESDRRRPIAYVTERRRRIAGAVLIAVGVTLGLAVLVARGAFWLAFAPLLIAWAGVAYAGGGRTGFYEVNDDGGLGKYLGRSRPDVGSMRSYRLG